MSEQKQKIETKQTEAPTESKPKDLKVKGEELKGDLDDLMNEIDNVLEKNAEEFVKNYVQRGGE